MNIRIETDGTHKKTRVFIDDYEVKGFTAVHMDGNCEDNYDIHLQLSKGNPKDDKERTPAVGFACQSEEEEE